MKRNRKRKIKTERERERERERIIYTVKIWKYSHKEK